MLYIYFSLENRTENCVQSFKSAVESAHDVFFIAKCAEKCYS